MERHDEISSTEKLLDLIRKNNTSVDIPDGLSPSSPVKRPKLRKALVVGIDLAHKDMKLVKVRRSSDQEFTLLDYRSIPFDPQIQTESPEFASILKAALTEFCGPPGKCELWALISAAQVEVRHIRTPKVHRKQIANAVYWTFKREVTFDEKESIFDFEVLGDVVENEGRKTASVGLVAPKAEVNHLEELFHKAGFPLTGISIVPFALQNLFISGWIKTGEKTVGGLYVGREWSRIDIFSSGNLALTRGIKTGMNSLTEAIMEGLNETQRSKPFELGQGDNGFHPVESKIEMPVSMDQAKKVLFSLVPDSPPLTESDPGYYLKEDEIFGMLLPALERLVRQIERSFEHYSSRLSSDGVTKLYVAGWIYSFGQLVDYISDQIGLPCDLLDPFNPENAFAGDVSISESIAERAAFTPALGMALSDSAHTPNFLYTYKDKEKQANITLAIRGIFGAFIILMGLCMGVYWWQGQVAAEKKAQIAHLQQRLEQYSPRVNQEFIVQLAAKVKEKADLYKAYGKRYLGMAIIEELSRITPSNIRLLNITAKLSRDPSEDVRTLVLEGIIFGHYRTLESALAAYLMNLEGLPIFGRPTFNQSRFESYKGKDVLHFTVHMQLI